MASDNFEHRGRDLPWLPIVRFHKEIACRAEESFFSLPGDDQAERWSSLVDFRPDDLAGPWTLRAHGLRSQSFQIALEQGQHDTVFLGGPCYLASENVDGKWWARWRPILYREVEITRSEDSVQLVPRQAHWQLCPLVYSLLDRLNASPGSLENLADTLVEKAASHVASGHATHAEAVIRALVSAVPEMESELRRQIRPGDFKVMPTPWVVFAPANQFSALTRYLVRDYDSLEGILAQDASRLGGLRLLDDRTSFDQEEPGEALPLVPLNDAQEVAVRAALGTRPLTVISGPPGCGKSQVVVSLLLNCWAKGVTVLFASNNNKAVDVVRERLERFESEFPIAVRAGARKHNNVVEVLRRTLNMAAAVRRQEAASDPTAFRRRSEELRKKRKQLEAMLASKLPHRIDETLRAALTAYSTHHTKIIEADDSRAALVDALQRLRLGRLDPAEVERYLAASRRWLIRLAECEAQADSAAARLRALQAEIPLLSHRVHALLAKVGWAAADGTPARWLLSGPAPELVVQWEHKARDLLGRPLEQDLQQLPWRAEFERWSSEVDAARWSTDATALADDVRSVCGALAPAIDMIERLRADLADALRDATDRGIPKVLTVEESTLNDWSSRWAEVCSLEAGYGDVLPWSRKKVLGRQLRTVEGVLRSGLPMAIWTRMGSLNDEGRGKLAQVVESCQQWLAATARWGAASVERETVDQRFEGLRAAAGRLRVERVPTDCAVESWQQVGQALEERAKQASLAALAWTKRRSRELAEGLLRAVSVEWIGLASGNPVKEAWRCGLGKGFDEALRHLAEQQSVDALLGARKAFYATSLSGLAEPWADAIAAQNELARLQLEVERMPLLASRVSAWASEREELHLLPVWSAPAWPTQEELAPWHERLGEVGAWCERWTAYTASTRPVLMADAQQELQWARQALEQAAALLPAIPDHEEARTLIAQSLAGDNQWATAELTEAFRSFGPPMISAKIDGIDAELERRSFDDAKARWLERLAADTVAVQAVDSLEKAFNRQRGELQAGQIALFRQALRLVPIWITTAQAPQAIPLDAELFDLVVIDEASQCTLTNLLPLMYRAKRLVVLGDENQLPAIPTLHDLEELVLARKFRVEDHLQTIGHANNDVFKAATEALPRRRGDVAMLVEHFRSHPLIIGFSNRHIYGQRLVIKKEPSASRQLPFGNGVHSVKVRGQAVRGARNRSWINEEEGRAVLAQIESLRAQAPHLSIGVVTPFAGQKDWLREQVQGMGLASEVLVDTAYGFQGDERDVIIFSAVVAKGITASACRWAESPPNLVNVALTRARDALFVVADFDFCSQQEGILKKLAEYCRDVQLLRDTSPAELDLYSWMVVEGLTPVIHPRVGDHEVDFELRGESGIRVAVEVDGAEHHTGREARDRAIDAYLEGRGYRVVRVTARSVFETPHEVMHQIRESLT